MLDYPYDEDDDSDGAVGQDDAPGDTTAPTQGGDVTGSPAASDASLGDAMAGLPDATGGYDMSTDPAMTDFVLNGSGSWPGGGYDLSTDPAMTDILYGTGSWPDTSDSASSGAAPTPLSVPVVPSDRLGGAASGPAIVQTLADSAGNSGPATYVPIVANTGAGLASLSDTVGGTSVPIVPGDYAGGNGDDRGGSPFVQAARKSGAQLQTLAGAAEEGGDGSNSSPQLTDVALKRSKPAGGTIHRPAPTEPDPVAAWLVRQDPDAVPADLRVDPKTGVMTKYDPTAAAFSLPGGGQPSVWRPVTPEEQQRGLESMLHAPSYAMLGPESQVGQMGPAETALRTLFPSPRTKDAAAGRGAANSSALPPGVDWGFIGRREALRTDGYVPVDNQRVPFANSGTTIATGFDLGGRNVADLRALGLPDDLVTTLTPYLQRRGQAAQNFLNAHPLNITAAQAQQIDTLVANSNYDTVARHYNEDQTAGIRFEDLPQGARTAIVDLTYQYGPDLARRTPGFWTQVAGGQWRDAYNNLTDFGDDYQPRRTLEAGLVLRDLNAGALPDSRPQRVQPAARARPRPDR